MGSTNFWDGFEKVAKEHSYFEKSKGVRRALYSNGESFLGFKRLNEDYLELERKKKLKHGFIGLLAGAGLGALGGLSHHEAFVPYATLLGAVTGKLIGKVHGITKAQKEYLKGKGIETDWGGLSVKFSPKAKKEYLSKN